MTDDRHYDLSITIVPGITGPRKLQLIANIDCPRRRNCLPAGVDRSPHNASAPKICRGQPRRENGLRPVRQHTRPFSRGCCPTVPCGTRAAADHFAPLPIFPRTCVCARVYVCVFFRFLFSVFFSHFFSCPFFFFTIEGQSESAGSTAWQWRLLFSVLGNDRAFIRKVSAPLRAWHV